MKSWKTPTPEQVKKAVALLVHPQQDRQFFDRLENPLWISPLNDLGVFQNPPGPIEDTERGTIRFPVWSASRYLARAGSHPAVMDAAVAIALTFAETENVTIHEDVANLALAVPATQAKRLVPLLIKWVPRRFWTLLPQTLGKIIGHLATGGEKKSALRLADALLALAPRSSASGLIREGVPIIEPWTFGQILERDIPVLIRATLLDGLELLATRLDEAVSLERTSGDEKRPEDYSEIWRPSIDSERFPDRALDALVSAVRDSAALITDLEPSLLEPCVKALMTHQWTIFPRLAFDLMGSRHEPSMAIVAPLLLGRENLKRFLPEYEALLRKDFPRLDATQQQKLLDAITVGPDVERWKEAQESFRDEPVTEAEAQTWAREWRYRRLAAIGSLPPQAADEYRQLAAEFGPRPVRQLPVTAYWVGPTSPKSEAELRGMRPDAVVEFLKRWEPAEPALGPSPSPEGLGRVLSEVVAKDAEAYSKQAAAFLGLDPTYARALIGGLGRAVSEGAKIAWTSVIPLLSWILDQPVSVENGQQRVWDRDPGWQWSRTEIGRLLENALKDVDSSLSFELRSEVWKVLSRLAEDPHPTPQHEAEYGGTNMDPVTLALNTTRGVAFHGVMRYALWTRAHLQEQHGESEAQISFAQIPEAQTLLERHLDTQQDPSFAVRAVFGQWFPWLVSADSGWASTNVQRIFPSSEQAAPYFGAAWNAYVVWCQPYDAVLPVLESQYRQAIGGLSGANGDDPDKLEDPERHLAEHLMTFYGRGKLDLAQDGLLRQFFERAPLRLRRYALSFVGRSLRQAGAVPANVLKRFEALWEWRLAEVAAERTARWSLDETSAFSSWFTAGVFHSDWTLGQLLTVMAKNISMEDSYSVVKHLAVVAQQHPLESVHVLESIMKSDKDGWALVGLEAEVRTVLEAGLKSIDQQARQSASRLIHELGSRGMFGYRRLLDEPPT